MIFSRGLTRKVVFIGRKYVDTWPETVFYENYSSDPIISKSSILICILRNHIRSHMPSDAVLRLGLGGPTSFHRISLETVRFRGCYLQRRIRSPGNLYCTARRHGRAATPEYPGNAAPSLSLVIHWPGGIEYRGY